MTSRQPPAGSERARQTLASIRGAGSGKIRVLLADDHAVLRQALRLLSVHEEIEVVGEAADGREAIEQAEHLRPDIILMDLAMPGLNGIDATRQLTQRLPGSRVLILTGFIDDERLLEGLRAGAYGYVVKRSDIEELLLAIQAVHRGNPYISSALSEGRSPLELLLRAQSGEPGPTDRLTAREREILQLVAEGHSNQSIADRLYLSVKTVEAHKAHIMAKLGVQKTADLIRYALRKGIISLDAVSSGEASAG